MENRIEFDINFNESTNKALNLFYCGSEKCTSGHSFGPAVRVHYLLHYVINGEGKFYVNNKVYTLKAGQCFLIAPGKSTYYEASKENPWEYCWIGFDGYESANILKNCGLSEENPILLQKTNNKFEKSLLTLIENFDDLSTNELALTGHLYFCFSQIYNPQSSKEKKHYEDYSKAAIEYIHNNFSYDIQISDIAKHIGIDRTYLYKLFKKEFKVSPQQYLISYRLERAAYLLQKTNFNTTEIAFSSGFKDVPAFCNHFKKKYKLTPLQYKKNHFLLL